MENPEYARCLSRLQKRCSKAEYCSSDVYRKALKALDGDAEAAARVLAALVEEKFPKLNGKVLINNIGGLIGAHTGPGTVALFFWGDERVD